MRRAILTVALLLAACSAPNPDTKHEGGPDSGKSGPDVGATQTGDLALFYRYGFRLPAERIAGVQEEHAAQCEALKPERCRIVGMTYEVSRDRTIMASLQFRLAPEAARAFGRQGVSTVVQRGGMLSNASMESEESGAVIDSADRNMAESADEARGITEQLAKPGLSAGERTQLQARLAAVTDNRRAAQAERADAVRELASTPMQFFYESGAVDPGLRDGPILGAIKDGWSNIVAGIAIILTAFISVLPWVAAFALLMWLWTRYGRRLFSGDAPRDE
nr:hypothetical protein [Sphingomonas sp. SCN 67-18]